MAVAADEVAHEKQGGQQAVDEDEAVGKGDEQNAADEKYAAVRQSDGGQDVQPALFAGKIQKFVDGDGGQCVGNQANQRAVDDFDMEQGDVFLREI